MESFNYFGEFFTILCLQRQYIRFSVGHPQGHNKGIVELNSNDQEQAIGFKNGVINVLDIIEF